MKKWPPLKGTFVKYQYNSIMETIKKSSKQPLDSENTSTSTPPEFRDSEVTDLPSETDRSISRSASPKPANRQEQTVVMHERDAERGSKMNSKKDNTGCLTSIKIRIFLVILVIAAIIAIVVGVVVSNQNKNKKLEDELKLELEEILGQGNFVEVTGKPEDDHKTVILVTEAPISVSKTFLPRPTRAGVVVDKETTPKLEIETTPKIATEEHPSADILTTQSTVLEKTVKTETKTTPQIEIEPTPKIEIETTPKVDVEIATTKAYETTAEADISTIQTIEVTKTPKLETFNSTEIVTTQNFGTDTTPKLQVQTNPIVEPEPTTPSALESEQDFDTTQSLLLLDDLTSQPDLSIITDDEDLTPTFESFLELNTAENLFVVSPTVPESDFRYQTSADTNFFNFGATDFPLGFDFTTDSIGFFGSQGQREK